MKDFSPESGWTKSLPSDAGGASETPLGEAVPMETVPIEAVAFEAVAFEAGLAEPGPADEPACQPLVTELDV